MLEYLTKGLVRGPSVDKYGGRDRGYHGIIGYSLLGLGGIILKMVFVCIYCSKIIRRILGARRGATHSPYGPAKSGSRLGAFGFKGDPVAILARNYKIVVGNI